VTDPGRVAAVDYGRKRIGLAVSDPLRITTRGLATLARGPSLESGAAAVVAVLASERPMLVVVGLPLHADGRESEMSAEVRRFAALLEAAGLRVVLHDEGLTSWEAEESLKGSKKTPEQRRKSGEVDQRAALGLLRSWLTDSSA